MLIRLVAAMCLVTQAAWGEADYVDRVALDDGRVLSTGHGSWATSLFLDDQMIVEDAGIALVDFGRAGVLVEFANGGNACPWSYSLIDRATGAFRDLFPGTERPTVFAECEKLLDVVPEANLMLTYRYDTRSHTIGYAWNGYALSELAIPISGQGAPVPSGGVQVTRWIDVDPYELLQDPVEQSRLLTVISDAEFDRLSWLMSFRSPAFRVEEFVIAQGCVKYACDYENAIVAIRISDGAPFVRMYDDGTPILRIPDGETMPVALKEHAKRYP